VALGSATLASRRNAVSEVVSNAVSEIVSEIVSDVVSEVVSEEVSQARLADEHASNRHHQQLSVGTRLGVIRAMRASSMTAASIGVCEDCRR
jgi:hypothetical protein